MAGAPARYLVFFQYFGTRYSGVMETKSDQALVGVQNYLEKAAEQLKPAAPIKFHISSRTDSGVHALANAAHLDIQRGPGRAPFTGPQLVQGLNHHLRPQPICILSAQRVSSTFHARFCALSRTYIYRLLLGCAHRSQIPVFERDLCWAPPGGPGSMPRALSQALCGSSPLDIPAMREAAQFLLGTHDFSTFSSPQAEAQSPVRTLQQLQLQPSPSLLGQHHLHRGLEFWEVRVKSKSFLYRQVRRMVGALVAVGQARLSPAGLQELLALRDPRALPPSATAPPGGLFLHSVHYRHTGGHVLITH
ncbi:tRNA pseudouridine synthase-like 1 isoform X4 [Serinus canaria]|uniref:tRNA pseudouridine synthase-like 1 isoform X2 n=1 Tax=Serinus canaria TaxID=9135 RepID=UPI0021CC95F4|nr:tRNA pseudouridine synthase-like 1 isoform X2 [Serinus canaria]XP_050838406.1 tRNA pseudouridine synthase-like 1 isoform X3 [Serinus canaria]XP_050838407.1 tRNA pseudouridine synthase-like 1 isoform X2 [Serinus canaria]XP_050838408.1 tRNA pseudouridine synthase-like 1 isoform X4 [Serinus canaria]XP_050838409.1 tRNA pseudouridine synthase-like 1 isoform X3 [Serinus canaria]XP_050838410.1 tRNA pseudouridine synthase-like 1 isoform X2 [Serinus canaria]XP_050838411.1 tRNA pseudouridine synthas